MFLPSFCSHFNTSAFSAGILSHGGGVHNLQLGCSIRIIRDTRKFKTDLFPVLLCLKPHALRLY